MDQKDKQRRDNFCVSSKSHKFSIARSHAYINQGGILDNFFTLSDIKDYLSNWAAGKLVQFCKLLV